MIYRIVWQIAIFISSTLLMFYALQALDFSKMFKKNSTIQIKIIILFISMTVGFILSMGIDDIIENIIALK